VSRRLSPAPAERTPSQNKGLLGAFEINLEIILFRIGIVPDGEIFLLGAVVQHFTCTSAIKDSVDKASVVVHSFQLEGSIHGDASFSTV
jgi:hypothetical protein